ncbi:MAG: hypothetical protein SFV53_01625 [Rickettsiales bacterium]|nr:hypothetical protein [Rickettsiales bacterium]
MIVANLDQNLIAAITANNPNVDIINSLLNLGANVNFRDPITQRNAFDLALDISDEQLKNTIAITIINFVFNDESNDKSNWKIFQNQLNLFSFQQRFTFEIINQLVEKLSQPTEQNLRNSLIELRNQRILPAENLQDEAKTDSTASLQGSGNSTESVIIDNPSSIIQPRANFLVAQRQRSCCTIS